MRFSNSGADSSRLSSFHSLLRLAIFLLVLSLVLSLHPSSAQQPSDPGLTAHEWGTFTSIAGQDGRAVDWLPLSGSNDLPGFVEHFRSSDFKIGLRGTVRMETPVLYFYASRPANLSVHVAFSKGVITEWYPHADRVEPSSPLTDASLFAKQPDGSITWNSVRVEPGGAPDFPNDRQGSHYYAARETSASPLLVPTRTGDQCEKFLFYRGVANFAVPLSVQVLSNGQLLTENLGKQQLPGALLFVRRGEKLGYRVLGALQHEQSPRSSRTHRHFGFHLEWDVESMLCGARPLRR